jgi:hypothetical protein
MTYTGPVDSAWEAIFMLLVLKIPLIYLAGVVWWAIRAEPVPEGGSGGECAVVPLTPCGWDEWKRRRGARRGGPLPVGAGGRAVVALRRRARARTA